jgi:hypothetical protein
MANIPIFNVSIIGSFRQHYNAICAVWNTFTSAGLVVTSPKGTMILEEGVPFVRFESDPADWRDDHIQTVALHRILRAQFVYVVAPNGYIGRTTCYEIGRIIQAKQPVYFSTYPKDLPIYIPVEHVLDAGDIVTYIRGSNFEPKALYLDSTTERTKFERDLLLCNYRKDKYFE